MQTGGVSCSVCIDGSDFSNANEQLAGTKATLRPSLHEAGFLGKRRNTLSVRPKQTKPAFVLFVFLCACVFVFCFLLKPHIFESAPQGG